MNNHPISGLSAIERHLTPRNRWICWVTLATCLSCVRLACHTGFISIRRNSVSHKPTNFKLSFSGAPKFRRHARQQLCLTLHGFPLHEKVILYTDYNKPIKRGKIKCNATAFKQMCFPLQCLKIQDCCQQFNCLKYVYALISSWGKKNKITNIKLKMNEKNTGVL